MKQHKLFTLKVITSLLLSALLLTSLATAQLNNKLEEEPEKIEDLTPGIITGQIYFTPESGRVRFHLACSGATCSIVKGAGKNTCLSHSDCKILKSIKYRKYPSRLGCRNQQCVILWEGGEDTCKTRADCAPKEEVIEEPEEIQPVEEIPKPAPQRPIYKIIKAEKQESLFKLLLKAVGWIS